MPDSNTGKGTDQPIARRGLIVRGLEGFNAHQPDRFVAIMEHEVVINHSAWPTPLRGRDAVRRFYSDFVWKAFPDMRLEREDGPFFHPHAPRVAFAWRVTGRRITPLDDGDPVLAGRRLTPTECEAAFRRRIPASCDAGAPQNRTCPLPSIG